MATKKTDAAKNAVKEEAKKTTKAVKETAAKIEKATKTATEKAVKETKTVAEKAAKATKTAAEKAEKTVKETAKKAEKKAEQTEKKVAKKAAAPKKSAKKAESEVYFEFAGKQFNPEKVVEDVKAAYVAAGNKESSIKSVKVYVKAEDSAAYFVINNKETGKIVL